MGHHSFVPLALRLNLREDDADQDKLLCILALIIYWDFVEAADRNDSVTFHAVIEFLRVIDWEPFGVKQLHFGLVLLRQCLVYDVFRREFSVIYDVCENDVST